MQNNSNIQEEAVKVETIDVSVYESQEKAAIDMQIATAKRYPRDLMRAKNNVIAAVTLDTESAKICGYALPRAGKVIKGASVHLARIIAQQYGNIRVDAKVTDIDKTHVTGQATCIDLENNVGIRVEVKRKIIDKEGKRYSDDMITVTGNAACSIALRNAIFNVVPRTLTDIGYRSAMDYLAGDMSDENKLIARRRDMLDKFKKDYGVSEKEIIDLLGVREITQIGVEEIQTMIGVWQAIKDGDTDVEQMFSKSSQDKKSRAASAERLAEEALKSKKQTPATQTVPTEEKNKANEIEFNKG